MWIKVTVINFEGKGVTEDAVNFFASRNYTCCWSPDTLMTWDVCCSCSWVVPSCALTCSEVGDWMGIWACVCGGNWPWGLADEGVLAVARGAAPVWIGAAACWAGWAGVLVEVELGWLVAVVAGRRKRKTSHLSITLIFYRLMQAVEKALICPSFVISLIIPVLDVGVAAEASGVKRNRCTWPLGSAACMSCWPGPGMTVTPWGMTCSWPVVWPWPWTITVRACWVPLAPACRSTPDPACCFCGRMKQNGKACE